MRVAFAFGALVVVMLEGCGARTGLSLPDAASIAVVDGGVPCVELPPDAGTLEIPLRTKAQLNRADVMFLIDNSASMQEEIERIQRRLSEVIAPAIQGEIVSAQFGVSTFSDFPVDPFGNPEDRPFELLSPMTTSLSRVQAAVDSVRLLNGRDEPEGQVEALYQLATGAGIGVYVPPSLGCPSGGAGYPCFRTDALPIILLFTDDRMHNGPGESEPYGFAISPRPHQYAQAVQALNRIGARVIGLDSGAGKARPNLEQLARDTNTLDQDGNPIVLDIGTRGQRLDTGVVNSIRIFASAVVFDIDAIVSDPDPSDGFDVTSLIQAIVPVRAEPMTGISGIDLESRTFLGVVSGTSVIFQLEIRTDLVRPGPQPVTYKLDITFRGDKRTLLDRRTIDIVVPGTDGTGCAQNIGDNFGEF